MTSAVHHTPSLSIPPTQNTALVLEFNCLYTHDIRRKQKRWQDGFLRFHTFNKRVMVYDVPRNFIGDMHWTAGTLAEGDEVMLEKDGVLVQVAEQVGSTETDLTEIRGSVGKKKGGRADGGSSPARSVTGGVATPSRSMAPPASRAGNGPQLKHRSLNALLGTPKGQLGKAALPAKSPFEERRGEAENEQWEGGRPPKRQRTEPWSVTRTTSAVTPKAAKETPLWARTSDAKRAATAKSKKQKAQPAGQQRLGTKEIVDLSDDGDESPAQFLPGFSSDALVPPTPPARPESEPARRPSPAQAVKPKAAPAKATKPKPAVRSSSPAFQTQNADAGAKNKKTLPTTEASTRTLASKKAQSSRPAASRQSPDPPQVIAPPFLPPATNKVAQTLRMASIAPRKKTLACLDQLVARPEAPVQQVAQSTSPVASKPKRPTQRELVEQRLAKIKKKAQERLDDLHAVLEDADADDDAMADYTSANPQTPATEPTLMDQMLLQPRASEPPQPQPASEPDKQTRTSQRVISESALEAPEPAKKKDRSFQRVASEHGTSISPRPKRVPGAPVRYTPSPTKRSVASDSGSRRGSTASVQSHTGNPIPPSKAVPVAQQEAAAITARHADTAAKTTAEESTAAPFKPPLRRKGVGRKEIRKSAQAALDTSANGTSTVILGRPFQAPGKARPVEVVGESEELAPMKPPPTAREAGPWSRDAFDLFEWRPPGWVEEEWRVVPAAETG